MIRPEHHDGLVALGALLQRLQHPSEHGVGEVDRGEVALDSLLPLVLFLNVLEVAIGATALPLGGQVVQVIGLVARRELNFIEGEGCPIRTSNYCKIVLSFGVHFMQDRAMRNLLPTV